MTDDRLLARLRQAEAEYCRRNPEYFVETYCHIEDKDAPGLIAPFTLWPGQKQALRAFGEHRLCVVLKARQLGFTWLALAWAARLLVLWPGRTVVGLSRTEGEAKELVRRLAVILENMPEFCLRQGAAGPDWQGAVFEASALRVGLRFCGAPPGVFQAFPSSPGVGRSFTADLILIDLKQPNMQPENNIVKNLVYSGSRQNVLMTMVNGRILYENQKFSIGVEPEDIYAEVGGIIRRMK